MKTQFDVIVIGSFVMALTTRLPRMPHAGESLVADLLDVGPGGKGSNLAVAVARQGKQVGLVAKLGTDLFSSVAFDLWHKEGIDTAHVVQTQDEQTGVALVYLEPNGQNRIGVYPGANLALAAAEGLAIEPYLSGAKVLALQLEIADSAVLAAMQMAHRHNLTVLLNPAPARSLSDEILRQTDVLTPNENESRVLLGLDVSDTGMGHADIGHAEVGRALLDKGPKIIIITLGEHGSLVVQRDAEPVHVPAYPVQAIDTVGAGDAFSGGLCVALAEGRPLLEAVRWASVTAALSVTHIGAIPGLPTRDQVDARFRTWHQ